MTTQAAFVLCGCEEDPRYADHGREIKSLVMALPVTRVSRKIVLP
jgi:hypothetical protein